jgi:integral membrane protein (TIGR01906 family)
MSMTKQRIANYLGILIIISTPIWLVLTGVQLLLTDAYLHFEYHKPDFPADPYGFTLEERLTYAPLAVEYLRNSSGIEFLADLTFPDGSLQYNSRELQHMADVKQVVRAAVIFHYALSIVLLAVVLWLYFNLTTRNMLHNALATGSMLTLLIIAVLVGLSLLSWDVFFTAFHQVFFEAGTWQFAYSDTLIRLFPERFWFDAALTIGIFTTAGALLLRVVTWLWGRKIQQQQS